jgi:hypothetical protein
MKLHEVSIDMNGDVVIFGVLATNGPIMAALDDGECGALGGEE